MNRRRFLAGAASLALPSLGASPARAGDGFPLADMHYHQFFPGTLPVSMGPVKPLAKVMADGNVTLLSWSLVGDQPWITRGPRGLTQKGIPESGAAQTWFEREIGRIKAHVAEQGLKLAVTPADIDKAIAGEPHVVLSVEGATFLDDDIAHLEKAYAQGVRHLQLVHYIRNVIGDFQTEAPEHKGLTERGKAVVEACNRLGILIDLAHATSPVVQHVLALSKAPVVWSHSFVARRATDWTMPMPRARHIALEDAKAIAAKGGVVGLWAMRQDSGPTPDSYGRRLVELAGMLGEDHVGVGTDMGAVAAPAVANYRDLRAAFAAMQRLGTAREVLEKIAIGNYARVLKTALQPQA
jgi:membrane dipeptidase